MQIKQRRKCTTWVKIQEPPLKNVICTGTSNRSASQPAATQRRISRTPCPLHLDGEPPTMTGRRWPHLFQLWKKALSLLTSNFHPGADTSRGASSSLDQQGLWRCLFSGPTSLISGKYYFEKMGNTLLKIWGILFCKTHSFSSRSLRFSCAPAMPTVVGMLVR